MKLFHRQKPSMEVIDIPIDKIKVINRMRKIDENNVSGLMTSIKEINLLHPICVARRGNDFILISGNHRREAFARLNKKYIPAVVREDNALVNQLVEIEENIVSKKNNAIQEAQQIVRREEILVQLGRKAVIGSNQYTEDKITNEELARQLGLSRRVYGYKKQVANMVESAQAILSETKFANNMMDMVKLTKEESNIQLEVANILASGDATTFNRAYLLAKLKFAKDEWTEENKKLKSEIKTPKSIMRFDRTKNELNDLCIAVSQNEKLRKQNESLSI